MDINFIKRLFIFILILILPAFVFKRYPILSNFQSEKTVPLTYKVQEREFIVAVLSDGTHPINQRNIHSIVRQNYSKYKVLYFTLDEEEKITILKTLKHLKSTPNINIKVAYSLEELYEKYFEELRQLNDFNVVVQIEGQDWLAHENVLSILNEVYQIEDVWMTYAQYVSPPRYQQGFDPLLLNATASATREEKQLWMQAPLKTFCVSLFKQVDQLNAQYKAKKIESLQELTEKMLPIVALAQTHIRFIPEVISIHQQVGECLFLEND